MVVHSLSLSHSLQASSPLTLPLSSFVLSLALHGSVVPGYLPQLQPDADTGSAGYGSESPGSVKCHFIQRAMLLSLFFFLQQHFTSRLAATLWRKMVASHGHWFLS